MRADNELMTFVDGIDENEIKNVEILREDKGINSFLVMESSIQRLTNCTKVNYW